MSPARGLLAYDPNQVKPGWIAFFLVLFLIIATFLLWRSMNTQLNRINVPHKASFGANAGSTDGVEASGSGGDADPPDPPDRV